MNLIKRKIIKQFLEYCANRDNGVSLKEWDEYGPYSGGEVMSNLMDETVKEICTNMLNEPDRWRIETYMLLDMRSGVKYWISDIGFGKPAITSIWNGHSRDEVFSYEQGRVIYQAYCKMKDHKASVAQQKVIDSIKPKPKFILYGVTPDKKWYEFWK